MNTLTLDIETAPLEVYAWDIWDQNISLNQIKTDTSIISCAWKWLDKPEVHYEDTSGRGPKKVRDDRKLMRTVREELDRADIVVVQNGQAFDIKRINARLLKHKIPPYSPVRVVDTKLVAKHRFAFTSNKLEYMAKEFAGTPKDDHKEFPGFELWLEVLKDNPKAWAVLKKYNKRDVLSTEKLYLEMRPWISNHPRVVEDGCHCPKCGSANLQRRGEAISGMGRYQRYQCCDCGGWGRGKALLTPIHQRKAQIVNL